MTFGDSGMSAQAAGFLPLAPLQIAFMKSVGLRPPSYLLPAMKMVGLPLAPLSCERLNDARSRSFPSWPSAQAVILSAGAPTFVAQAAPFVATSLLFSFWQRMKSNAFAGAYFLAQTWKRSPLTSFGPCIELGSPALVLADVLDVQVDVGAELRDDVLERRLRLHAVRALGHDVEIDVHRVRAHVLRGARPPCRR